MIYFPCQLGDCFVLRKKCLMRRCSKRSLDTLTASVQILTQHFKTTRESVSRGAIDSCSLSALPECVDVSDESHVYITPATMINAAWGSQWYQRSCT